MLYLLFFLLTDGRELSTWILDAIPLRAGQLQAVASKFTVAIRATSKARSSSLSCKARWED